MDLVPDKLTLPKRAGNSFSIIVLVVKDTGAD